MLKSRIIKSIKLRLIKQYVFIILAIASALFAQVAKAKTEKLYLFDIDQLPANVSLSLYGKQSQQTLLYSYQLTQNTLTNKVSGYYTREQALTVLLRGTGLAFELLNDDKAKVTLNPAFKEFTSTKSEQPTVQPQVEQAHPVEEVEKISVIGKRGLQRSLMDLPVPVDIISSDMLIQSGQTSLGRMLQAVAPSFNYSSSSISDGTDAIKPATLRGLGPDQTLILVNGKRRHYASLIHINTSVGRGTAGADLNTIPVEAIERIEILRDGAAAQYGSDAIAGVINIVLKGNLENSRIKTAFGQHEQGDGESFAASVNTTFRLKDKGFINTTIAFDNNEPTDRAGLIGSCLYEECQRIDEGIYQTSNFQEIHADRNLFEIGDPKSKQVSLALNGEYALASGNIYGFSLLSTRENRSAAFFRDYSNKQANPILSDGSPVSRTGYLPYIHSSIDDVSLTIGYETEIFSEVAFDISYSIGKNSIEYTTENSLNASYANYLNYHQLQSAKITRDKVLDSAKAYGLSLGLQTVNMDFFRTFDTFELALGMEFRQENYQVKPGEKYSYYDYDSSFDYQHEDGNALGGIQGFPGISLEQQVDESRNMLSAYGEVTADLTDALSVTAALRWDEYESFGSTLNYKLASHWQVTEALSLRGSLSSGFKAPSMQQLYFNNTSTQFIVDRKNKLVPEQVGTFRNDSELAKAVALPQIHEEQSRNLSLGAVVNFNESWQLTMDYYQIHIDDRIVISNKLCPEFNPILADQLSLNNVDKAQVFFNGIDTKTTGFDVIASWKKPLPKGYWHVNFAANFTDTKVIEKHSPSNGVLQHLTLDQVFDEQDISIIEEWQPQDRVSFTSKIKWLDWHANIAINRYGKYTILDGDRQTYQPEILTDFRMEHDVNPSLSLILGINNMFNATPDKNTIGNSHGGTIIDSDGKEVVTSPGVFTYSRRSAPFGFNGRYYYAGFEYNF